MKKTFFPYFLIAGLVFFSSCSQTENNKHSDTDESLLKNVRLIKVQNSEDFVLLGQEFNAKIIIPRGWKVISSKTFEDIEGGEFLSNDSLINYNVTASKEGINKLTGAIEFSTDQNKSIFVCFATSFNAVRPSITVDNNLLIANEQNEVFIKQMVGPKKTAIKVTIDNGKIEKGNKEDLYYVTPNGKPNLRISLHDVLKNIPIGFYNCKVVNCK